MSFTSVALWRPFLRVAVAAMAVLCGIGFMRVLQGATQAAPVDAPVLSTPASDTTRWQSLLQRAPDNHHALAQFGLAQLAEARLTGDPMLYAQAERAFNQVLAADSTHLDALIGQGMLALARHDFAEALTWAAHAEVVNPFRAEVLGIRVDALVELGRYAEAVAVAQAMVDLRPGLEAYARIAYLRELHGDVDGAIAAMQAAAAAGVPGEERTLWCLVQLGRLHAGRGDLDAATAAFDAALAVSPTYLPAQAELALLDAARGRKQRAIAQLAPVVQRLPLPAYVIALGELHRAQGDAAAAREQFDLALALQELNAAAGMDVDLELALFLANHGDAAQRGEAVRLARQAYATRATIHTADALAWALYRNGAAYDAWPYMAEALRLGTQDAAMRLRAAEIARAADLPLVAADHEMIAYAINPTLAPQP